MIRRISVTISEWLLKEKVVECGNQELFSYAAYCLLLGTLPLFIILILGLTCGMVYEGIIMLVPYMLIRKFSGGYHLNSPTVCLICSSLLLSLALALVKFISCTNYLYLYSLATSISVAILCILSPIDSEARRLSERERLVFRNVSRLLALCTFIIYIGLLCFQSIRNAIPVGMGINLAAFLQLPCLVDRVFKKS